MSIPVSITRKLNFIPFQALKLITGRNSISVFYHTISDVPMPHIRHLYSVRSSKAFIRDLDFLLKHFNPIDLESVCNGIVNNKKLPANSFFLSFDDGLKEFHDVVAPILEQKGVPATCFLNSAFVDNKDMFFRFKASLLIEHFQTMKSGDFSNAIIDWFDVKTLDQQTIRKKILSITYEQRDTLGTLAELCGYDFDQYLHNHQPYMTSAQVDSLIKRGFSFGSHSIDHPLYTTLDEADQVAQTERSAKFVKDRFSPNINAFAFPFTDDGVKASFFESIFSSNIVDISFGTAGLKDDSAQRNVQRIALESGDLSAKEKIRNEYFAFMAKAILNKNTITR